MPIYNVVDTQQLDADLARVADAIRTTGGSTALLGFPNGFIQAEAATAAEADAQTVLIRQIAAVLQGKVSGNVENQIHDALDGSITTIDSRVTKVVAYACRGLTALETVKLPAATVLGNYAFYGCTALRSLEAPLLTALGSYAFYQCRSLREAVLPAASGIPSSCFFGCTQLELVDIGVAGNISDSAFSGCSRLKHFVMRREDGVVALPASAFGRTTVTAYFYVPRAQRDATAAASNWNAFPAERFRVLEDYTVDGTVWGALDAGKI